MKQQSRNPSRCVSVDANRQFDADAPLDFGANQKLKKGRNKNVSALFLNHLTRRHRPFGMLERGPRLGDLQRDAAA